MEKCQVLIIDDEPIIAKVLSFAIKKEGCIVETASDGGAGMRKIKELKPKIVLLDVMMPNKSGFDICSEVKSDPKLKDTYIILLTAKVQDDDFGVGYSRGADDYITKPFDLLSVVKKIKELLPRL
jgi:two-component system alkaline phosphatase synthesis response regulator PhoP